MEWLTFSSKKRESYGLSADKKSIAMKSISNRRFSFFSTRSDFPDSNRGHISAFIFTLATCALTKCSAELLAGGESCLKDGDCFSGHCYIKDSSGICAPDSPINGTIAAGSDCQANHECFSNFCFDGVCASESQAPGFVAGGGFCSANNQCYSGVCYKGRCGAESEELGRSAAGSWCNADKQCYSRKCKSNRCGADSPVPGVVPSGGHCNAATNWCSSKVCHRGRCTSAGVLGKVADGGKCTETFQCMNGSVCRETFCVSSSVSNKNVGDGSMELKRPKSAGERCTMTTQCAQSLCIHSYCAPPSPSKPALIADGGECDADIQCHSGQCENAVCATSYADHQSAQLAAAGAVCTQHEHCYSGVCVDSICSAESPPSLEKWIQNSKLTLTSDESPSSTNHASPGSARGVVAGGGLCTADGDCYSGFCVNDTCAPDGPLFGTIANGGVCDSDKQCFSLYCRRGKCAASSAEAGKLAPGCRCQLNETVCGESSRCIDGYCVRTRKPETRLPNFGEELATLSLGEGRCWRHVQCRVGRCLYEQCTASWFILSKWIASSTSNVITSWLWIAHSVLFSLLIQRIVV